LTPAQAVAKMKTDDGMTIEIDNSAILEHVDRKFEEYKKELKKWREEGGFKRESHGKGVIEARLPSNASKLIEQFKNVRHADITEQWTIAIPSVTRYEAAAHLRDYVFVTDILKGEAGDTVNIPYVKDLDFEVLAAVGNAFNAETTSWYGTYTTTLKEAGAWSDIEYFNIEKMDANFLDEVNRTLAHAAVRAEDQALMALLVAGTATTFAGDIGSKTGTAKFYSKWIPQALGKLLAKGKEIHPGDCVLYITARSYVALLEELAGTTATAVAYARSDIIQKGMIEEWLGVKILVGGWKPTQQRTNVATGICELAFLFRAKRCLALAPKRDILIETDRQIAVRELRLTASHTFGVNLLDPSEAVRIWTSQTTASP